MNNDLKTRIDQIPEDELEQYLAALVWASWILNALGVTLILLGLIVESMLVMAFLGISVYIFSQMLVSIDMAKDYIIKKIDS